jgi:predicted NAD/FAD-dependent oxidoreductase
VKGIGIVMLNIAVIGAGLSGLTAANILNTHANVTIFDKAKGPSGRLATRRAESYNFDHGCQFFIAKSGTFKEFLAPMLRQGVIKPWNATFVEIENRQITKSRQWDAQTPHYVGSPSMNAVGKFLSQGLSLILGTAVTAMEKTPKGWVLKGEIGQNLGQFDWVVSAIPAQQAAQLWPEETSFYTKVKLAKMERCFTLMLGFEAGLPLDYQAALVRGEDISWISVNSSKPDRNSATSLLVHSNNGWATQHDGLDRNEALQYLLKQTSLVMGQDVSHADHKAIHKWRYANCSKRTGETHFIDHASRSGACGDWLIKGRVEAAFTSGYSIAQDILSQL